MNAEGHYIYTLEIMDWLFLGPQMVRLSKFASADRVLYFAAAKNLEPVYGSNPTLLGWYQEDQKCAVVLELPLKTAAFPIGRALPPELGPQHGPGLLRDSSWTQACREDDTTPRVHGGLCM